MTRKYKWVIDKDHLDMGDAGTEGPSNAATTTENEARFRMYDDDETLYYSGRIWGDYDGFEPLDDFGTANAGAVAIQYKNNQGQWEYL